MRRKIYLSLLTAGMILAFTGCSDHGAAKLKLSRDEGISYMNNGQYEEAVTSFESAYSYCDEKMPKTKMDILLYEAACKLQLEDYEGLKNICESINTLGESAQSHYMKGVAELKLGEDEAAATDFEAASELNPKDYQMFLNIYRQYEKISKSAIGDVYIQKALEIPNETMDDYYEKGSIYYYLKDYSRALEELAIPVQEKDEKSMLLMGQAYLGNGENTSARNLFQQYLEQFGESATAYNGLALCDLADNAYDTALTDIQSGLACEMSDDVKRELLYNEIVAYEMKKDFETAKEKAAAFVELFPDDKDGARENQFLKTR